MILSDKVSQSIHTYHAYIFSLGTDRQDDTFTIQLTTYQSSSIPNVNTADAMIIASFGSACGISPNVLGGNFVHCTKNLSMKPFVPELVIAEDHDFVSPSNADYSKVHVPEKPKVSAPPMTLITLGLLISATITISLASVDQSSMITAQYVLFGFLLLACASFCRTLHLQSASTSSSNQNDCHQKPDMILGPRPFDAMGPVLFNFAFVVTAPPLSCGAQGLNGAIQALTIAIVVMGTLYLIVGWFGAPAAVCAGSGDDTNLLSLVLKGGSVVDIASTITFGLSQLAAIPVYCELARETMDTHIQAVLPKTSFWLCHVAPWAICAISYNSELFESFVEWSSLLLLGFCNFSLPLLIELTLKEQKPSTTNLMIRRAPGQGPDPVLWVYALVSSSIMAVIVQRISDNILLSEMAFMITLLSIFYYY